jgi:hypothetical protein
MERAEDMFDLASRKAVEAGDECIEFRFHISLLLDGLDGTNWDPD